MDHPLAIRRKAGEGGSLSPQQNRPASDYHGLLLLLRLLQLRIFVDGPAPYRSMSRRRLIGGHFKRDGSNISRFHNGRAMKRAASRHMRCAYLPQRIEWLAPVTQNRRFAVVLRR